VSASCSWVFDIKKSASLLSKGCLSFAHYGEEGRSGAIKFGL
jgi:hypothetical protein